LFPGHPNFTTPGPPGLGDPPQGGGGPSLYCFFPNRLDTDFWLGGGQKGLSTLQTVFVFSFFRFPLGGEGGGKRGARSAPVTKAAPRSKRLFFLANERGPGFFKKSRGPNTGGEVWGLGQFVSYPAGWGAGKGGNRGHRVGAPQTPGGGNAYFFYQRGGFEGGGGETGSLETQKKKGAHGTGPGTRPFLTQLGGGGAEFCLDGQGHPGKERFIRRQGGVGGGGGGPGEPPIGLPWGHRGIDPEGFFSIRRGGGGKGSGKNLRDRHHPGAGGGWGGGGPGAQGGGGGGPGGGPPALGDGFFGGGGLLFPAFYVCGIFFFFFAPGETPKAQEGGGGQPGKELGKQDRISLKQFCPGSVTAPEGGPNGLFTPGPPPDFPFFLGPGGGLSNGPPSLDRQGFIFPLGGGRGGGS